MYDWLDAGNLCIVEDEGEAYPYYGSKLNTMKPRDVMVTIGHGCDMLLRHNNCPPLPHRSAIHRRHLRHSDLAKNSQ